MIKWIVIDTVLLLIVALCFLYTKWKDNRDRKDFWEILREHRVAVNQSYGNSDSWKDSVDKDKVTE